MEEMLTATWVAPIAATAAALAVVSLQVVRSWRRAVRARELSALLPAHGEPRQLSWGRVVEACGSDKIPVQLREVLQELVDDLSSAGHSRRAQVATCNHATSELNRLLGSGRESQVGWRVCFALGVICATALFGTAPGFASVGLAYGLVGAALTWQFGRMADYQATRLRQGWNGLIRRLARSFPEG